MSTGDHRGRPRRSGAYRPCHRQRPVKRKAQGIERPLNIIACENMVRGTSQLKGHVFNALAEEDKAWVEAHIGFVDSAVDRIVPPSASATHDPLEVTVETFSEWIVDKTQFKGELPNIPEWN